MAKTQSASNKTTRKVKCSKAGRAAKKSKGRGNPISLFVRGLISAESYFKQTVQK